MPSDANPTAIRLEAWRETILNWTTRAFFVGPAIVLAVTAPSLLRAGVVAAPVKLALTTLVCGICAFTPGHVRARARAFLGAFALYATLIPYDGGISGGIGLGAGLVVIFGVVLLGRRDAIVLTIFVLVMWWIWWARLQWGLVARPALTFADTGRPEAAFRIVLSALIMLPVCLFSSDYLIRKLTETLAEAEALLGRVRAQMAELEAEVQRREQAEKKLLSAQKTELLAQLAGGVAHDVNNNLTIVRSGVDLLVARDGSLGKDRADLVAAIREACDNAAGLTRQLLAIGRRDVVRRETVAVRDALERMRRIVRPALRLDVALSVSVPVEIPNVLVDPGQFLQALLNLALNARDAMPNGGALTVNVEHGGPTPAYDIVSSDRSPAKPVRVHVCDEGTGIGPDTMKHVLDPFFTTKGAGIGSGLGLTMVCAFVEANGGRLGVRSRLGEGSTFTLELPGTSEATRPAAPVVPVRPGATILVVEDDDRVRTVLSRTLRDAGYVTFDVATGEEALARAESGVAIDLLCTDARLPGLQGEELVRRFRTARPTTPILVCSAYVDDAKLRAWIEDQALHVVRKPFAQEELVRAIASALASTPRPLRESAGSVIRAPDARNA